ncbi:MAG: lytic murein transglycosylase [Pseudomonadota bacterium]
MKKPCRKIILCCFAVLLAAICSMTPATAGSQETAQIKKEFQPLTKRLESDGFAPDYLEKVFSNTQVVFDPKGVSLFFVHSESSLDYDQFLSDDSIAAAASYMTAHKEALDRAQEEFGVDKTIITAIILVETRLGAYVGNKAVINTLSTMASLSDPDVKELLWRAIGDQKGLTRELFDKKTLDKAEWAYAELKALLKFSQREGLDPVAITGSYAGAMGISQFMPSNALTLAKDGDKDGAVNLFQHDDAIHSIANYLKHYGWKPSVTRQQAHKILYKYNRSNYYVDTLLKISDRLKG